jgi:peptidoglycan glycosyltransferase
LKSARAILRPLAWGLAALAPSSAVLAWLGLSAGAELARGRERLLAGDTAAARAAFSRACLWPGAAATGRAGEAVTAAADGRVDDRTVPLDALLSFAPEALLLSALEGERLDAAAALASLARRSGLPLAPLYEAVVALERDDEAGARAAAARSTVPLDSRGLGTRLRRAFDARERGAVLLLLDRNGELAATVGRGGAVEAEAGAASLLAGVLGRAALVPDGPAVRLSIDLGLSRAAREALGERRGSIVLVEPSTGAVLAAVSDERTLDAEGAAAFTQRREPASIAKVLTAAAAYRAGLDADAEIRRTTCTGVERYGGKPLWCPFPAGPLDGLDHALALSCNVAFASLGVRLGAERMTAEYRAWGFGAGEQALLGTAGRVHAAPRDPRQVADLSVGLEVADVTPLHAALLAAVVANDGRMPAPRLVTGACGMLGLRNAASPPPPGAEVVPPAIARRLRRAMEAVAAFGTGTGLAPRGFPIAMKTGTAAEPGRGYHANYIGMGPLPDPAVAFCIRVTNEHNSPAVTRAAREVARRLLGALADRRASLGQTPSRAWTRQPHGPAHAAGKATQSQSLPRIRGRARPLARGVQRRRSWATRGCASWWPTTRKGCSSP